MPYIKADDGRREALRKGEVAQSAGELNYQIFYYVKHAKSFLSIDTLNIFRFVKAFLGEKPNYQKWNDMTGALIRCAKEIERRLPAPNNYFYPSELRRIMESYDDQIADYEDIKIKENSDVE